MISSVQMEVTESLTKRDSSAHGLSVLGSTSGSKYPEQTHGSLDKGDAKPSSGTYSKTC